MSEATIRTAVYNVVNGVSNTGNVYDYERWAATWDAFLALFKTTIGGTPQVRGFDVAYRGYSGGRDPKFSKLAVRAHRFLVQGYMRLDDSAASEKTFGVLVEAVCDALDADSTLHGSTYQDTTPASVETFEQRMFGDVFCHYAAIALTVTEETT